MVKNATPEQSGEEMCRARDGGFWSFHAFSGGIILPAFYCVHQSRSSSNFCSIISIVLNLQAPSLPGKRRVGLKAPNLSTLGLSGKVFLFTDGMLP